MPKKQRLNKKVLQEKLDSLAALKAIADYAPSDTEFSLENITEAQAQMSASQTVEVQKQAELDAAKDAASGDERGFHNFILGVKTQVKAQYGENSNEYQSMGMKKKEEYKVGRRAVKPPGNTT